MTTSRGFPATGVIVVGAGPTGLMRAGELVLAGVASEVIGSGARSSKRCPARRRLPRMR
ncbi:MAG: FAD-dependent monooxygenase [Pseudonocardiaceae bacterium]